MIAVLKTWALARLVPILLGGSAIVALLVWDNARIGRAEKRGEELSNAKTEKQNDETNEIGQRGSSHDGKPVSGSVRDPRYRD